MQHDPIYAPTWNACQGSPLHSFIAAASCNGQGTEASFPYDAVDDLTCNASPEAIAERSAVQNLSWAFVPSYPNSNADLMRAVTYAPTLIGVRAGGKAWQYYRTGVVPCSADADVIVNTRKYNICSCTNLADKASCCLSVQKLLRAWHNLEQCGVVLRPSDVAPHSRYGAAQQEATNACKRQSIPRHVFKVSENVFGFLEYLCCAAWLLISALFFRNNFALRQLATPRVSVSRSANTYTCTVQGTTQLLQLLACWVDSCVLSLGIFAADQDAFIVACLVTVILVLCR